MIFFVYMLSTLVVAGIAFYAVFKIKDFRIATIAPVLICLLSIFAYKGYLEQVWAKAYGGSMTIAVPEGTRFFGITWKDSDLWVGWYDPKSKECVFKEDSKYNILQGNITVKNCNPVAFTK